MDGNKTTDETLRWENYRLANNVFPNARAIELSYMLEIINPQEGEKILECGTGNGYLTFPLAKSIGHNGQVITYDVLNENLESVKKRNNAKLPIKTMKQTVSQRFEEKNETVDKIVSLATFHHYDDRLNQTGTSGRSAAMRAFARMLKPGGQLIIGDIAQGTISNQYFDAIDNPIHCHPRGHPHNGITLDLAKTLCENAGLNLVKYEIKRVPWVFSTEDEARKFIHTLHNAKCTPQESYDIAKKHLGLTKENGKIVLGWELAYLIAKK